MRGRGPNSHVASHLPGARPPAARPRLLLLFSPLQLGLEQSLRKPRGLFFFFFEGVVKIRGQEGGGG